MTLAEMMADSGRYSIDSTTRRAHVPCSWQEKGFIKEPQAARRAGSPASFTVRQVAEDDRSPSI